MGKQTTVTCSLILCTIQEGGPCFRVGGDTLEEGQGIADSV